MKIKEIYKIRPDILAQYFNEIIELKYDKILKKNIYLEENHIIILCNQKTYIINIIEFNNKLYWHLYYNNITILFYLSIESFINIINLIQNDN